ncbi:MAG: DUF6438 domain-containing protein [Cyclobacteriaceae bacterium]
MISLSVSSQTLTSKVWVNSDHQTLEFANDTAVFRNAGREEVFGYTLEADQLTLIGAKALDYKVSVSGDSLKLSEWEGEGALKKKSNGGAVHFNQIMRLSEYDDLDFANASSLVKELDDFKSIRFQSSACMGTCPVLDVTIKASREVSFNGEAYTDHAGHFSGELDKLQMKKICDLVKEGDLVGLKSRLKTPLDFPSYTLTIDYGEEEALYTGYGFYEPLNQLVRQFLDFDTTLKLEKLK